MGFRLTTRDINIIRAVQRFRLLGARSHVLPLFGDSAHLLRRLQKLYKHKYLYRLPGRQSHEEAIYGIGNAGSDLLSREYGHPRPRVDWTQQNRRLGGRFVAHTLLVADLMIAIELACRDRDDAEFIGPAEILETRAPQKTREKRWTVGGRPFRWRAEFRYEGRKYQKSIEPDRMFGLSFPEDDRPTNWFFLEADRATMPVKSSNLNRSSIFKKQLQYWHSSRLAPGADTHLHTQLFGINENIRTLFVMATGARGNKRLRRCINVNKHFEDGRGTGLFLFAKKEHLLEAGDILTAPLTSGRGSEKLLTG